MKALEKKWYKKWWIWVLVAVIAVIICVVIPIAISHSYIVGKDHPIIITAFSADSVLEFYGGLLAFIGTILLGALAFWQNDKLHKMNLRLEKQKNMPMLSLQFAHASSDITFHLTNISQNVANNMTISGLSYYYSDDSGSEEFIKSSPLIKMTRGYVLAPLESNQVTFKENLVYGIPKGRKCRIELTVTAIDVLNNHWETTFNIYCTSFKDLSYSNIVKEI